MPYRVRRDRAETWLLAASPIPTGLIIAIFNDRFTSRSWRFAGGIPGGYSAWAGILLVCGVGMLACMPGVRGPRRQVLLTMGMVIAGVYWFILGSVFFYTAVIDQLANPLGGVAWWTIAAYYWIWVYYEVHHRRLE